MNYTQNYHLGLPIPAERYDVSIVNANNTVIDGQLKTNADAITNHKNDHNNPHAVTAAQVGLGNVDNTADANKPVSTAQAQYVTQAVSAESTRATGAENTLSGQISAEVTRATGAESTLADNLSTETTRATGAESTLSTQITNEVTRAQGAESDLRDYVDEKLSVTYKASGSVFFADLPALAASREGHVYNIKDDFATTTDFVEGAGKDYPAGTNVAIIEKDEESYEETAVEETDNPSEMGLYELDGSDYVLTTDTSPIEGKTYYELTTTPSYFYDVLAGFIDTSDFITDTDYATAQTAGIVKPDGTTVTVDENGVISSIGGGDVSSEEMADVVNILGAKNLAYSKRTTTTTKNGVTFRRNNDYDTPMRGTVRVSGTPTADFWHELGSIHIGPGEFVISDGQPSDSDYQVYFAAYRWIDSVRTCIARTDEEEGLTKTFSLSDDASVGFGIGVKLGGNTNTTIYPMCRPSSITDDTYVPYARTNKELEKIANYVEDSKKAIESIPIMLSYLGAKNLIYSKPSTSVVDGITYVVQNDGRVNISGTVTPGTGTSVFELCKIDLPKPFNFSLLGRTYTYGGPNSVSLNIYKENVIDITSSSGNTYGFNTVASQDYSDVSVRIIVQESGENVNKICEPILYIHPTNSVSMDYVPPAKTNRQLTNDTDAIEPIVNVYGSKNLLCNEGPDDEEAASGVLTFHKNNDGTVTVNGNLDDYQPGIYYYSEHFKVPRSGNYILSKAGDDAEDELGNPIFEHGIYEIAHSSLLTRATKEDVIVYLEKDVEYEVWLQFYEAPTVTLDNRVFYPMIRDAGVKDSSFVPYAKTNRQLTEDVETLQQTTFSDMTGATSSSDGTHGLVPAPLIADRDKYLKGDGTWQNVPNMTGATSSANGTSGLVPQPLVANRAQFLRGDGVWATPTIERSYVGMIIHSTTLNTMAKVVAFYGGTTWIQHSGYVLRGATSGVTANSAVKTGGADTVTLTTTQIPSHAHGVGVSQTESYGAGPAGTVTARVYFGQVTSTTSYTGGGQAHSTVPNYKSVYIWERTV